MPCATNLIVANTQQTNHPAEHYENFPVASWLCPQRIRPAVVALYRFARTADDLADEGTATATARLQALNTYRTALQAACTPARLPADMPWQNVMLPLQAAIAEHALPTQPLHDLITAFEQDVQNTAAAHVYADWDELARYANYSANPVGRLMLHLYGVHDASSQAQSDAICTALQYYNFWQDISVDIPRKRYYLPLAICQPLGIDPRQPQAADVQQKTALMRTLLEHTDACMQYGMPLPSRIAAQKKPGCTTAAMELRLVIQGGWRIGQKTRNLGAAVIQQRPVLHAGDWLLVAMRSLRSCW